jgi:hypothetical protein
MENGTERDLELKDKVYWAWVRVYADFGGVVSLS